MSPPRVMVLVADDEAAIRDLLTIVIQRLGLVVICVADGAAAVAAVQSYRNELRCAILDVVMPVMNGIDAAHTIQGHAPSLPIVLMTGAIPTGYQERLLDLRLAGVLAKPFSFTALRELVRSTTHDPPGP